MSEWWTYRLSDFLMFAPRTYYRLFELLNAELWPLPLVMLAAGLVTLWLVWRGAGGRVVAALLAAAWIVVAWAYHFDRYATIHTAAPYYAAGFAIQALLLVWCSVRRDGFGFDSQPVPVKWSGLVLLAAGVVFYPLLAPLLGRPWSQVEIFGVAPDPTTVATLGVLLLAKGRAAVLLALPLLWCAITALTLWTMEAPEAAVPASAFVLGAAMALGRWRARAR
ncbi:MAG: hypothetical protein K2Y27_01670 [Xanthobacteraceae bacterium]|nr:hypothetical protein [Xanthobacteraceae bacterium]